MDIFRHFDITGVSHSGAVILTICFSVLFFFSKQRFNQADAEFGKKYQIIEYFNKDNLASARRFYWSKMLYFLILAGFVLGMSLASVLMGKAILPPLSENASAIPLLITLAVIGLSKQIPIAVDAEALIRRQMYSFAHIPEAFERHLQYVALATIDPKHVSRVSSLPAIEAVFGPGVPANDRRSNIGKLARIFYLSVTVDRMLSDPTRALAVNANVLNDFRIKKIVYGARGRSSEIFAQCKSKADSVAARHDQTASEALLEEMELQLQQHSAEIGSMLSDMEAIIAASIVSRPIEVSLRDGLAAFDLSANDATTKTSVLDRQNEWVKSSVILSIFAVFVWYLVSLMLFSSSADQEIWIFSGLGQRFMTENLVTNFVVRYISLMAALFFVFRARRKTIQNDMVVGGGMLRNPLPILTGFLAGIGAIIATKLIYSMMTRRVYWSLETAPASLRADLQNGFCANPEGFYPPCQLTGSLWQDGMLALTFVIFLSALFFYLDRPIWRQKETIFVPDARSIVNLALIVAILQLSYMLITGIVEFYNSNNLTERLSLMYVINAVGYLIFLVSFAALMVFHVSSLRDLRAGGSIAVAAGAALTPHPPSAGSP